MPPGGVRPLAPQPAAQHHVVDHPQPGIEEISLAHIGDAAGQRPAIVGADGALVRLGETREDLQQAALADPAGAEQGHDAAAGDVQGQVFEDRPGAETQAEPLNAYARAACRLTHYAGQPICQKAASSIAAVRKVFSSEG
jgi:hypothetical protein